MTPADTSTAPAPVAQAEAMSHLALLPPGWPRPRGYSNGVAARGKFVFVGGQIGWDAHGRFRDGFIGQVDQALQNIVAVLAEAGARPAHLVRLTWYVTDLAVYTAALKDIGAAYRQVLGPVYPPMSVVQVCRLVEPQALVEIEATAVIPD